MMRLAVEKFLALGRDEDGAALVTTLAMFFFMFVTLAALFAFGKSIRERIRVQNACDAAAYSAAVVQADTLSRVAVMNRQMAWTYVQMTRRQLDYIVMNLLSRACAHYDHDRDEAEEFAKDGLTQRKCSLHKLEGCGWYIGANGQLSTMEQMQVNGLNGSFLPSLPTVGHAVNLGAPEIESVFLKGSVLVSGVLNIRDILQSGNAISMTGQAELLLPSIARVAAGFLWGSDDAEGVLLDKESLESNKDTLASLARIGTDCTKEYNKKGLDGSKFFLKQIRMQILADRVAIAALNLAERKVVHEMPGRIRRAVQETLRANLPDQMVKDCRYRVIQEEHPLAFEVTGKDDPTGAAAEGPSPFRGYFANLHNNHNDERRFLEWAGEGYGREKKVYQILGRGSGLMAGGIDQWFVRGNGAQRTEGMPGIQRCYKHWDEFDGEAKHNPYVPSCWNKEHLHESRRSVALFCEWQWWADRWFCFGKIHIPFLSRGLLGGGDCGFDDSPDSDQLAYALAKIDWLTHLGDVFELVLGGLEDPDCKDEEDGKEISRLDSEKKDCPMEKYDDGCLRTWELVPVTVRTPLLPQTFYSRVYADDRHLYNEAYVGECAKPLVLRQSYFGRNGTITVCVACRTENAWSRLVDAASGLFSIFNPHGEWLWAFASAKAGHRDPKDKQGSDGEQGGDRCYYINYVEGDKYGDADGKQKPWNLIEEDWDAVMVPVRAAASLAMGTAGSGSVWAPAAVSVVDIGMKSDGWRNLDDDTEATDVDWSEAAKAPPGMGDGGLNWKELADVMYH